jgi:transglutaminase-like putative cysteine protease
MRRIKFNTMLIIANVFILMIISACRSASTSYKIVYNTEYSYSKPVALSDHIIRLHTFENDERIISCKLIIDSANCIINNSVDKYDQQTWLVHFPTKLNHFKISVCLVLDTTKLFVHPNKYSLSNYNDLPDSFLRVDNFNAAMYSFLKSKPLKKVADEEELLHACNNVFQQIEYAIHEEPGIYSTGELLERGIGSCRDMTWFLVQYLRSQQIKARVVSGYLINWDTKTVDLHLWAEAKSEEGKWVGLDPTSGSFITPFYIPVSIGENPNEVAPLEGFTEPCEVKLNYDMNLIKE